MSEKLRLFIAYIAGICFGLLCIILVARKGDLTLIALGLALMNIIIASIYVAVKYEKENKKLKARINQQKEYARQCNQARRETEQWQHIARIVSEDIDDKVEEYEAKQKATEFNEKYRNLAKLIINFNKFDDYYEAVQTYDAFSPRDKALVTIDMKQIRENYLKALHTQVKTASAKLNNDINRYKPVSKDYENWQSLVDYYESLPEPVRSTLELNEYTLVATIYDGFTFSKDDRIQEEADL